MVGCVKSKRAVPAPARDLYISPLFMGRRRYVESTCRRWFILSALHGLVTPDEVLAPYDATLLNATSARRRAWSKRVLAALDELRGPLQGLVFEIHAGKEYRDFGLVDGLRVRGAEVEVPAAGLGIGKQLTFYASGSSQVMTPAVAQVRAAAVSSTPSPPRGSYAPLGPYLDGLGQHEVMLSFSDVEQILGRPLPASARKYQAWWANEQSGTHSHARAWLDVGWEARNVDLDAAHVRFVRGSPR